MLVVSPYFAPARFSGGSVTTLNALARSLNALGARVRVVASNLDGGAPMQVPVGCWQEWDGVPVYRLRTMPLPWHYTPGLRRFLNSTARGEQAVISVSNLWLHSFPAAERAARKAGIPHIVYPFGMLNTSALAIKGAQKRALLGLYVRRLLNRADRVVALSHREADEIRAAGVRAPVQVIPNGIDLSVFAEACPREQIDSRFPPLAGRQYLLFLGRLHPIKGIELLLDAFAAAPAGDLRLAIAGYGDEDYLHTLRRQCDTLGMKDRVLFVGAVEGAVRAGLYRHARAFALTSRGESQPMAALEALACGTPTLLTRECNIPEVEESEAGWLVPRETAAIAAAIGEIARDPTECERRGRNGRALVEERFSIQSISRQTIEMIREVIDNHKSRG